MTVLGKAKKADLIMIAKELEIEFEETMRRDQLKNLIYNSKQYDGEFITRLLEEAYPERTERERIHKMKIQKIKDEIERLKAGQSDFSSVTEKCSNISEPHNLTQNPETDTENNIPQVEAITEPQVLNSTLESPNESNHLTIETVPATELASCDSAIVKKKPEEDDCLALRPVEPAGNTSTPTRAKEKSEGMEMLAPRFEKASDSRNSPTRDNLTKEKEGEKWAPLIMSTVGEIDGSVATALEYKCPDSISPDIATELAVKASPHRVLMNHPHANPVEGLNGNSEMILKTPNFETNGQKWIPGVMYILVVDIGSTLNASRRIRRAEIKVNITLSKLSSGRLMMRVPNFKEPFI